MRRIINAVLRILIFFGIIFKIGACNPQIYNTKDDLDNKLIVRLNQDKVNLNSCLFLFLRSGTSNNHDESNNDRNKKIMTRAKFVPGNHVRFYLINSSDYNNIRVSISQDCLSHQGIDTLLVTLSDSTPIPGIQTYDWYSVNFCDIEITMEYADCRDGVAYVAVALLSEF